MSSPLDYSVRDWFTVQMRRLTLSNGSCKKEKRARKALQIENVNHKTLWDPDWSRDIVVSQGNKKRELMEDSQNFEGDSQSPDHFLVSFKQTNKMTTLSEHKCCCDFWALFQLAENGRWLITTKMKIGDKNPHGYWNSTVPSLHWGCFPRMCCPFHRLANYRQNCLMNLKCHSGR